jgi:hypothetical protein
MLDGQSRHNKLCRLIAKGENMNLPEIVEKLTGPIQPIGESNVDHARLENIDKVIELTESLVNDLIKASTNATRYEASMKAIGVRARTALREIMDNIDCNV